MGPVIQNLRLLGFLLIRIPSLLSNTHGCLKIQSCGSAAKKDGSFCVGLLAAEPRADRKL